MLSLKAKSFFLLIAGYYRDTIAYSSQRRVKLQKIGMESFKEEEIQMETLQCGIYMERPNRMSNWNNNVVHFHQQNQQNRPQSVDYTSQIFSQI